jgi:NADPH-dependent F420 reductase
MPAMTDVPIGLIGGTGREGTGLARRLARAGFSLVIGSRSTERAREAVAALGDAAGRIEAADNATAIRTAGVLFLCVPFSHARTTIEAHQDAFQPGSLLIDVTVPVSFEGGKPTFVEMPEGSAAEHVRRYLPEAVRMAAALKAIPARMLGDVDAPLDCDDFVCGDSAEARDRAIAILQRFPGLRAIDVGALDAARVLERMTLLAIRINRRYKVHDTRFRLVGLP